MPAGRLARHLESRQRGNGHTQHAQQQPHQDVRAAPVSENRVAVGKGADGHLDRREQVGQRSQQSHQGGRDGQLFDHHPVEGAVDRHQRHGHSHVDQPELDALKRHAFSLRTEIGQNKA